MFNGYYDNYATGFQVQQLIFDSNLHESFRLADLVDESNQDLKSASEDVIVNTYIAYLNYLASARVLVVDSRHGTAS